MTLLNLECVLQADNQGHDYGKQHTFRGDPGLRGNAAPGPGWSR